MKKFSFISLLILLYSLAAHATKTETLIQKIKNDNKFEKVYLQRYFKGKILVARDKKNCQKQFCNNIIFLKQKGEYIKQDEIHGQVAVNTKQPSPTILEYLYQEGGKRSLYFNVEKNKFEPIDRPH